MGKGGAIRLPQAVVDAHNAKLARTRSPAAKLGAMAVQQGAPVSFTKAVKAVLGPADVPFSGGGAATQRMQALGRLKPGTMNNTEQAYDELLAADPTIAWRKFEGIKLRLADNTFYTPDFFLMRRDGGLECHEVKGFWTDDARVKIKVAASLYPFQFVAVQKRPAKDGGWKREEF